MPVSNQIGPLPSAAVQLAGRLQGVASPALRLSRRFCGRFGPPSNHVEKVEVAQECAMKINELMLEQFGGADRSRTDE